MSDNTNDYMPIGGAFYIVPDTLREAINKMLDAKIAEFPEASQDREYLYHQLVAIFNKYGVIPDFTLERIRSNEPEST